jgi:hypothetical protein
MFFWLLVIRPRRLRACHGRSPGEEVYEPVKRQRRRHGRTDVDGELAQRDALIAKLEERVRVLERIATDGSARLRAEIESLRDRPDARD